MYQKDYILRLIEQMVRTLAVFFGLLKKEDFGKAGECLGNAYYELLKEEAAFFRGIPEEDLTSELLEKHNYTNDHLEIVAELFNAEAELCLAQGNKRMHLPGQENHSGFSDILIRQQKLTHRSGSIKWQRLREGYLILTKPDAF